MFGALGKAVGGMFGANTSKPQDWSQMPQQEQPQGIGPSMAAMGGMMGNQGIKAPTPMGSQLNGSPVPQPPPTAQAPEAMGQAPMMKQMPQMGAPMGPSPGMMQQMMRKPPMMNGVFAGNRPPMSGGMGGWGNRGIQGPQQSQQFVSHPMAGSSYGGYR